MLVRVLYPPSHYPATYATLPRPAQHHHPASATNRSRAHPQAHTRSQREQRRHPAISHRNRCARTVKRPGGPVPALLQNSEIDLFTHSPFASRPLTHSHGAPFGGALRARSHTIVHHLRAKNPAERPNRTGGCMLHDHSSAVAERCGRALRAWCWR